MIILYFILFIGPLIFVHELGHFVFAKLFDVKVLKFSLGFGPKATGFTRGETEYVISWIPLGGYVKMLGQDPTDEVSVKDQGRALHQRPLWQRYFIVLAGPAFNLIFPVFVAFFFLYSIEKLPPATIGTTLAGTPAAQAGLKADDRLVAIDGERIRYWDEMDHILRSSPGKRLRVTIERDGKKLERYVTPQSVRAPDDIKGGLTEIGRIGVMLHFRAPQIGIANEKSSAVHAGLRRGDLITSLQGKPLKRWEQLERALAENRGEALRLSYLRPGQVLGDLLDLRILHPGATTVDTEAHVEGGRTSFDTGIRSVETFVAMVEPGSPAEQVGLVVGARILKVDAKPVTYWWQDVEGALGLAHEADDEATQPPHMLTWQLPDGTIREKSLSLSTKKFRDQIKKERLRLWFGAHNDSTYNAPKRVPVDNRLMFALTEAPKRTLNVALSVIYLLPRLIREREMRNQVGSLGSLAALADEAAAQGLDEFVNSVAGLSIQIGILNLLPIPILDGGHVVIYTVEAVRRRPLTLRTKVITSYIGLFLILLLFAWGLSNDFRSYVLPFLFK